MTRKNIHVVLNGDPLILSPGRKLVDCLMLSGYDEKAVAVTLNGYILVPATVQMTELNEGDIIEVSDFARHSCAG